MKILLTGKDGQLGSALSNELKLHYDVSCFGRTFCDITNIEMVENVVKSVNPDIIVNARRSVSYSSGLTSRPTALASDVVM